MKFIWNTKAGSYSYFIVVYQTLLANYEYKLEFINNNTILNRDWNIF